MRADIAITFNDNEKAFNVMLTSFHGPHTSETSNEWEMGDDDTYALYFYAYDSNEHTLYLQYGMPSNNYLNESNDIHNLMEQEVKEIFGKDNVNNIDYGKFQINN